MDEKKPRRRWLSFGIRDLLWAMVVAGLLLALGQQRAMWWDAMLDYNDERLKRVIAEHRYEDTKSQLDELVEIIQSHGETNPAVD
jgi:hypothetical protein